MDIRVFILGVIFVVNTVLFAISVYQTTRIRPHPILVGAIVFTGLSAITSAYVLIALLNSLKGE